jgi:hypothetical protein
MEGTKKKDEGRRDVNKKKPLNNISYIIYNGGHKEEG